MNTTIINQVIADWTINLADGSRQIVKRHSGYPNAETLEQAIEQTLEANK